MVSRRYFFIMRICMLLFHCRDFFCENYPAILAFDLNSRTNYYSYKYFLLDTETSLAFHADSPVVPPKPTGTNIFQFPLVRGLEVYD